MNRETYLTHLDSLVDRESHVARKCAVCRARRRSMSHERRLARLLRSAIKRTFR